MKTPSGSGKKLKVMAKQSRGGKVGAEYGAKVWLNLDWGWAGIRIGFDVGVGIAIGLGLGLKFWSKLRKPARPSQNLKAHFPEAKF